MTRTPVESTRIASWGWEDNTLQVEFKNPAGAVYEYQDVPEATWGLLQQSPGGSVGKAFNSLIRDAGFAYQRIS